MSGAEPIDLIRLREATMGDEEFLRELVGVFRGDASQQLLILQQAIQAADAVAVYHSAHRLKGSGANLGAHPFSELCFRLEQVGKQGDLQPAPAILRDLQDEFTRLEAFLARLTK